MLHAWTFVQLVEVQAELRAKEKQKGFPLGAVRALGLLDEVERGAAGRPAAVEEAEHAASRWPVKPHRKQWSEVSATRARFLGPSSAGSRRRDICGARSRCSIRGPLSVLDACCRSCSNLACITVSDARRICS